MGMLAKGLHTEPVVTVSELNCSKKNVYTNSKVSSRNPYATSAHPAWSAIVASGLCMALVVKITLWTAAGRYYH